MLKYNKVLFNCKIFNLFNGTFEKNSAQEDGGAIYFDSCPSISMQLLILQFNNAKSKGNIIILSKKGFLNEIKDFIKRPFKTIAIVTLIII